MRLVEKHKRCVNDIVPLSAWESFHNPRLEGNQDSFLNAEHISELKDQSEIVDYELQGETYAPGIGMIRRLGIVTKQGYCYSTFIGIPENPESEVPIIATSAWTTSTEGHNEHTMRNLMRAGNYVFFVGAEGSYEPEHPPEPISPITLASSAAAVLNFSYHAAKELIEEGHKIDPEKRVVLGESRGGMVGMGIIALAEEFAQCITYADLTAPCLPRRMRSRDLLKLLGQLTKEPAEVCKLLGKMTIGRMIHYPATFDPSPNSVKHQFAIGFALFSGEAGALARCIKRNALMHITVFEDDFASMKKEWEAIFEDFNNVHITSLPGSHLTLADLQTLQYIIGRNKAAQICEAEGEQLTRQSVFMAAHDLAREQRPLLPV